MKKSTILPIVMCLWLLLATSTCFAQQYTFTSFFYQGSTQTYALGINNNGQVVGNALSHGFTYSGGNFTTINYPNAFQTNPVGINNGGQIVGWYLADDPSQSNHGFLYSGGNFMSIDYPNAIYTNAFGINDAGHIVGTYYDGVTIHGFLYSGGNFTSIDYPNAAPTVAQGINNAGQIVGFYYDALRLPHGFLYTSSNFTAIDVPNSDLGYALGINNSGQIVGYSQNAGTGGYSGFLYSDGNFTTIDYPNAGLTYAYGINDSGQISGTSAANNIGTYGFMATPINPYKAFVQQPINADGSSVFKANRGVIPVKFTLTHNDTPTCALPPATISVTRTAGGTVGLVDVNTYLTPANSGSNFRIDPTACQYVYNLAASSLGVGAYRVDISINGIVVGHAVFALQ